MKWTEKELLESAQKIKDYCHMIKHTIPKNEGDFYCDKCIFAEKSDIVRKEPRCLLQDNYGKPNPWLWPLDKVQIDEETLF